MDLDAQKQALRRKMSHLCNRVTVEQAAAVGAAGGAAIAATEEFERAAAVALFASRSDEPSTAPLFDLALSAGKTALLPRCTDAGTLTFFRVESWEDLRPGSYGVLEPGPALRPATLGQTDLVLVPGVAFDRCGGRLGRGRGYYDRTFPVGDAGGAVLFGMAFAFQMVDWIPAGRLDRRVDAVVTEEGVLRVARPRSRVGRGTDR